MSRHAPLDDFGSDERRRHCFGCGQDNPHGLHLQFALNEQGNGYLCEFTLDEHFVGPPGHVHGGIIATILDEAMGKALKLRQRVALTRRIQIEYLRPVPLHQKIIAEGRIVRVRGRALYNQGELRTPAGKVLAKSKGVFITVDPEKMFQQELAAERQRHQKG